MRIIIRRIYSLGGVETGAVLTAIFARPTDIQEKFFIETRLIDYAFNVLYPNRGLDIFRDMYADTPSITAVIGVNELQQTSVDLAL
jgi:hypothetical protein